MKSMNKNNNMESGNCNSNNNYNITTNNINCSIIEE